MPLYTYKCIEHGTFDEPQRMDEEHKANCPKCNKEAARVYHVPALAGDLPTTNFITSKDKPYLYKDLKDEGLI